MSKVPLIFVLLCVTAVVQCGSTASQSSGQNVSPGRIVVKAAAQVFKALREFFDDVGHSVKNAFSNLANDVALALVLRSNLLLASIGIADEQVIPHDKNEKYYTMAMSTANLCGKLSAMEKCVNIVMDGSKETAEYLRYRGWMMSNKKRFEYFTTQVESKIHNDSELSAMYKHIKTSLPVMSYMDLREAQENEAAMIKAGVQVVKFMLYKMHVQHSYVNMLTMFKKEHHVTARSVFELAKQPSHLEALQTIYDQTISEVINSWENDDSGVIFNTPSVLYTKLEEKISSKPELKGAYEEIKKMVENSSEWTVGLFDIDLLPW